VILSEIKLEKVFIMLGSILKPLVKISVMGGTVVFSAILLARIVTTPLHYIPTTTPLILRLAGVYIPLLLFGAGIGAVIFAKEWRVLKYSAPIGILAPSVIFIISYLFAIPQMLSLLSPMQLLLVIVLVISSILILIDLFKGKISGSPWFERFSIKKPTPSLETDLSVSVSASTTSTESVGAFEIVEMPEEYIFDSNTNNPKFWEPFRNMLRAMMASGAPFGFRFERIWGQTRIYYLTLGKTFQKLQENMDLLQRLSKSMLPKFRFERLEHFTSHQVGQGVVGTLTGEILSIENPRQRPDPMTVVAESLLQLENGVFQIYALPVSPGVMRSFNRMLTNRDYRSMMQKSQHTISTRRGGLFSGGGEASSTVVDIESTTEADKLFRKYQRQS